ncbi:flagellar filament capping protein FliD, partial [Clostridium sp.]|uniref:flagellar filament capping protein FliD n=1 Tax=Clostridium sp. TaxID=1506 RepID=UPI00346471E0
TDGSLLETYSYKQKAGKDAVYDITLPGMDKPISMTSEKNSFTLDNITFSLNFKGETSFTIKNDTSKSVDKIKGFVEDYNKIIGDINKKVSEKKTYKYLPLTEEQRTEMKEDEIKKWEAKGKEGLLRNDDTLNNIMSSLRKAITTKVEGTNLSLNDIGISFNKDYLGKYGQLTIDENKLTKALEENGEEVMKVLAGNGDDFKSKGVFTRIKDVFNDNVIKSDGALLKKAGFEGTLSETKNSITESVLKKDKLIKEMERSLFERENNLYIKFARLEKEMNKANAQQGWLMQQFSGGM